MKIAVTYKDGEVFQHFGQSEYFKLYQIEEGQVAESRIESTNGNGHSALVDFLKEKEVDALICGGIGGGAKNGLRENGITLYPGVTGDADDQVKLLLLNQLNYDADTQCSHHAQEHETCEEHDKNCK